jgi:uncharacterized membrane protein YjjP (DUF1212 family)
MSSTQSFEPLQEMQQIQKLMERSTRFTSLSGLSCIAAGICALIGGAIAYKLLGNYYGSDLTLWEYNNSSFANLKNDLLWVAAIVFVVAAISAFFFTWRKSKKQGLSMWEPSSKRVFWAMVVPLVSGGIFVLGILRFDNWYLVAPACLVFYGLALVNAGKFTISDIRYLGYCLILLGLINIWWVGYGLYFWVLGFGVLHIVYGVKIYLKEKNNNN